MRRQGTHSWIVSPWAAAPGRVSCGSQEGVTACAVDGMPTERATAAAKAVHGAGDVRGARVLGGFAQRPVLVHESSHGVARGHLGGILAVERFLKHLDVYVAEPLYLFLGHPAIDQLLLHRGERLMLRSTSALVGRFAAILTTCSSVRLGLTSICSITVGSWS